MQFLNPLLQFLDLSKYTIVFILCIFEGPVVMISSGFLYRLGQFNLLPLFIALVTGDFVADMVWYAVGRFAGGPVVKKFGKYFNITPAIVLKIEERFKRYQDKILFISKITMGFGFALATLIVAGILKVDFKKYALLNLLGGFIWTSFLLVIGYFFGHVYDQIVGPLKIAFIPFAILVVVIGLKQINKYLIKHEI